MSTKTGMDKEGAVHIEKNDIMPFTATWAKLECPDTYLPQVSTRVTLPEQPHLATM